MLEGLKGHDELEEAIFYREPPGIAADFQGRPIETKRLRDQGGRLQGGQRDVHGHTIGIELALQQGTGVSAMGADFQER